MDEKQYGLRERKYAQTKINLTRAFIKKLISVRFSDISIKEVCDSVQVSEGTFFNYFPNKLDVLVYYMHLVEIKIAWNFANNAASLSSREQIRFIFEQIRENFDRPFLFYEVISVFAGARLEPDQDYTLSPLEKYYAFSECPGIENTPEITIRGLIRKILETGTAKKEIGGEFSAELLSQTFMAVAVGIPLAAGENNFADLSRLYRRQLDVVFRAMGGR